MSLLTMYVCVHVPSRCGWGWSLNQRLSPGNLSAAIAPGTYYIDPPHQKEVGPNSLQQSFNIIITRVRPLVLMILPHWSSSSRHQQQHDHFIYLHGHVLWEPAAVAPQRNGRHLGQLSVDSNCLCQRSGPNERNKSITQGYYHLALNAENRI